MPPSKNTDQGMGASLNSDDRWSASFQVTWKVPGEVRSPGRPVVIGAKSTTRPSRTSQARLRDTETQAPFVSPHGRAALVVVVVRWAGGRVVTCEVATAGVAVRAAVAPPVDTAAGTMLAGAGAATGAAAGTGRAAAAPGRPRPAGVPRGPTKGAAGPGRSAPAPGSPGPAVIPSAPTSATAEPAIVVLVRMSAPGSRRGPVVGPLCPGHRIDGPSALTDYPEGMRGSSRRRDGGLPRMARVVMWPISWWWGRPWRVCARWRRCAATGSTGR